MARITSLKARTIIDSRGLPTIEVDVILNNGTIGRGRSPSGASTGSKEAVELRDNDKNIYCGKSVYKAINNVLQLIQPAVIGFEIDQQEKLDGILIDLDGTENKSKLGANTTIATSMAFISAAAAAKNLPVFKYLNPNAKNIPTPMMNLINGGVHANNRLDIQEFMIIPSGVENYYEQIRSCSEIFWHLKNILEQKNYATTVGDEGGFAPNINTAKEAIELLLQAIEKANYKAGEDIFIGLDVAASELFNQGFYNLTGESKKFLPEEFANYLEELTKSYPISSIEDALHETDYKTWNHLYSKIASKVTLVGDDLFATNSRIFSQLAIDTREPLANAILIKPNQVGTISEMFQTINLAKKQNFTTIMSHRSGETEDSLIAHLAVASEISMIKAGSISRGERTAKYNELLRIADQC